MTLATRLSGNPRLTRAGNRFVRLALGPSALLAHVGLFLVSATGLILLDLYRDPGTWAYDGLLKVWGALVLLHAAVVAGIPFTRWLLAVTREETESVRNAPAPAAAAWPAPPVAPSHAPEQPSFSDLAKRAGARWQAVTASVAARLPSHAPASGQPSPAATQVTATGANGAHHGWPVPPAPNGASQDGGRRHDLWQQAAGQQPAPSASVTPAAPVQPAVDPLAAAASPDAPLPGTGRWSWVEAAAASWLAARESTAPPPPPAPAEPAVPEPAPAPAAEATTG